MKLGRVVLASAVGVGASGFIAVAQQQPQPTTLPAIVQAPAADVAVIALGVRLAATPSSAVASYAAAVAQVGINPTVEDAYVRRMVEFNLPDMAESQAQDVVKQDPNNDVARAVVAYMLGRRGEAVDALATIVQTAGGDRVVADVFVLRTAGQLVAWYDTRADKAQIPEQLRADVEAMRQKLSPQDAYRLAYGSARDAYQGKAAPVAATDQPQQPLQPQPSATSYESVAEATVPPETYSPAAYDNSYSYTSTYPVPYGYSNYYYQPYYYWSPGYRRPAYPAYDPTWVSPVIIPRGHHHDRDWGHGKDWNDGHHHDGGNNNHDGNHSSPGGGGGGTSGLAPRVHQYDEVRTTRNRNETVIVERAIEPNVAGRPAPPVSQGRAYQEMQQQQQPKERPNEQPKQQQPPQQQPRQQRPQADGGATVIKRAEAPARTERKADPPAAAKPAPSPPPQRSNDRPSQQQQQQRQSQPSGGDRKTR